MSSITMIHGYGFPRGDGVAYGELVQQGSIRYPSEMYARQVAAGQQPNPMAPQNQLGAYCAPCAGAVAMGGYCDPSVQSCPKGSILPDGSILSKDSDGTGSNTTMLVLGGIGLLGLGFLVMRNRKAKQLSGYHRNRRNR